MGFVEHIDALPYLLQSVRFAIYSPIRRESPGGLPHLRPVQPRDASVGVPQIQRGVKMPCYDGRDEFEGLSEIVEQQPIHVGTFADLDQRCCALYLGTGIVDRGSRRSACDDRKKHEPVPTRGQP